MRSKLITIMLNLMLIHYVPFLEVEKGHSIIMEAMAVPNGKFTFLTFYESKTS